MLPDLHHSWCGEGGARESSSQLPHTARHQRSQVHKHAKAPFGLMPLFRTAQTDFFVVTGR